MIEIRFHGRGGQGAVLASKILAQAFFLSGRYAQSFPAFWAERRGAPVGSFLRVDKNPILLRGELQSPRYVIVLDESLFQVVDVTQGLLPEDGAVFANSSTGLETVFKDKSIKLFIADCGSIATKHGLGTKTQPIVNTAILGFFAAVTDEISLETILAAIEENVPVNPKDNMAAAQEAYETYKSLVLK